MEDPKPGTTLKLLTEEYEMMEHMRDILSKKIELDRKYAKDLRTLYDSIHPKCKEGVLGSLFKPFINVLYHEYLQREVTCEALAEHVSPLPYPPLNQPDEVGVRPSDLYEPLQECFLKAGKQHYTVSSIGSVLALQEWYQLGAAAGSSWETWRLPIIDRRYRQAVSLQHAAVKPASDWHNSRLLDFIEKHQSTADFVKSKLRNVLGDTIDLCAKITQECSIAISAIDGFSSLSFIAPMHEVMLKEGTHPQLQPFVYHNYWLYGEKSASPMFGTTREKFYEMANALLDLIDDMVVDEYTVLKEPYDIMVSIERSCQNGDNFKTAAAQSGVSFTGLFFSVLTNHDPLIALDILQFAKLKDGVPRNKIASLLPQDDLALWLLGRISEQDINPLWFELPLTHRKGAFLIVRDIFMKWDFAKKRPFPSGVSRYYHSGRVYPRVVFTKTGRDYAPQS